MTAVILFLLASSPMIDVAEREDAAIVIVKPFGAPSRFAAAKLVESASAAFETETDLRGRAASEMGLDVAAMLACPQDQRLTCWVELASKTRISLLLIVTVVSAQASDRVAMTMLDVREARGLPESDIYERIADVSSLELVDPPDTFKSAIAGELRPFLEKRGHFRPLGDAIIDSACAECSLIFGERSFPAHDGPIEIHGLRAGAHELAFQKKGATICRAHVDVVAGATARGSCVSTRSFDGTGVLLYGGAASATLGVAGVVASIALLSSGPSQVCVGRVESGCDRITQARSGFGADGVTPIASANRGFPLLPAGAGLLVLGAVWSGGALLFDGDDFLYKLLAGVVLGSATTAIALAIE